MREQNLKILMLAPHPAATGPIPRIAARLVDAFRARGCTVRLRPWGRRSDAEGLFHRAAARSADICRTYRDLRSFAPDILFVTTAHDWPALLRDIPLILVAGRTKAARVVQLHGSNVHLLRGRHHIAMHLATALLAKGSDAVLVLSHEEAGYWRELFPDTAVHVVRNVFVPLDDTGQSSTGSFETTRPGAPVVLFVGRVIREKGVFEVVEAVSLLRRRAAVRARIVGDGQDLEAVRTVVRASGLAEVVAVDGRLEGGELARAYMEASVFAFPTAWPEGFPTVLLEAAWAGLPIVTTRTRGAADVFRDGENALFVRPRDSVTLARAIERLLVDRVLAQRMVAANRALLARFEARVVADEYLAILRSVAPRRTTLGGSHGGT